MEHGCMCGHTYVLESKELTIMCQFILCSLQLPIGVQQILNYYLQLERIKPRLLFN